MMKKKEKKPHGVQLLLRAVVRDPDGKIITDTGRKPSRSFVIQFLEFMEAVFKGLDLSATDVAGAENPIYLNTADVIYTGRVDADALDDTYGIQVGTGDTPEANTQYALDVQLTEGVGAGNITHGAMVIDTTAVVGANVDLELKRAFTNLTGSTITVKEAGLVVTTTFPDYEYQHLIIRDVLPASVEVPDKCSLTVIYTLRTTV